MAWVCGSANSAADVFAASGHPSRRVAGGRLEPNRGAKMGSKALVEGEAFTCPSRCIASS